MRILLFITLLITSSCFKTAEDIEREKRFEQLAIQVSDSQKLLSEMTMQNEDLKTRISSITGTVEEAQHKNNEAAQTTKTTLETTLNQLSEQVQAMNVSLNSQQSSIDKLQSQVSAQATFTAVLSRKLGINNKPAKKAPSKLSKAFATFDKKQYTKAKPMLLELLGGKISAANRNKVLYKLGTIEYNSKKYTDSLVYFSKIYTKWPKSSLAPGSLYYIARSLQKTEQSAQAKASFEELMNKYPKSNFIKYAKKEIKKL